MESRNLLPNNHVAVSRLRGITILYENDLYELANIVLKITSAADKLSGIGIMSTPTINGLAKQYSFLSSGKIDSERISESIVKHGLDLGDIIEFDRKVDKSV